MSTPTPDGPIYEPTERTTLGRLPERGSYDHAVVNAILDEALICHVGFATDRGPVVIPTIHARVGDTLYLHGSPASGMIRSLKTGIDVCVTVSLVDGLVLARSAFHHSLNYRSVILFGRAGTVDDLDERSRVLDAFVDQVIPGRRAELRPHTDKEIRATQVLAIGLEEASAKVRTGPPNDDADDIVNESVWAGVLPLGVAPGPAEPAPDLVSDGPPPAYVAGYSRP
jgi:nitroimidazol reductase NimA-like FMN-containing flavoprotein (pyridoxamine 5'-phosphate oxidase superfamily)